MARSKSVILSPAEKKSAVSELKAKIKAAELAKKDAQKIVDTSAKAHAKLVATHAKATAASDKELGKLNDQLNALLAPVVSA